MGCTRTGGQGRGFTLIELLMVIAVVALLMAVLLPVRKQSQAVVCQAKLRQWGIGFSAYVGDHEGRMPGYVATRRLADFHPWFLSLKPYTTDYEDILLCPTARRARTLLGGPFTSWSGRMSPYPLIVGSYGYNSWLTESHDRVAGHAGMPVI